MGTWCGQVGGSIPPQAFPGAAIFCPRPRLFSTRYVESDGNLMWTSGCEHCSAGVSKRGEILSRSRGQAPCRAEPTLGSSWHQPSMGSALQRYGVFHTRRGKRWEFAVDKCRQASQRKRFAAWCFFIHLRKREIGRAV